MADSVRVRALGACHGGSAEVVGTVQHLQGRHPRLPILSLLKLRRVVSSE